MATPKVTAERSRAAWKLFVTVILLLVFAVALAFLAVMMSLAGLAQGAGTVASAAALAVLSWRRGSRRSAVSLALAAIAVTVFLWPLWRSTYRHDRALGRFTAQLCSGPLPERTVKADCDASVGLTGNGNHCD